ncbi:MAG: hypothetical protein E7K27_07915, partial [[Clostridium] symbiosum]|nr:hypothetical protein [[Clostridium] symbiosum]
IKISCMYERVNINCAEVNSTRQMGSGIYFFISVEDTLLNSYLAKHIFLCNNKTDYIPDLEE